MSGDGWTQVPPELAPLSPSTQLDRRIQVNIAGGRRRPRWLHHVIDPLIAFLFRAIQAHCTVGSERQSVV